MTSFAIHRSHALLFAGLLATASALTGCGNDRHPPTDETSSHKPALGPRTPKHNTQQTAAKIEATGGFASYETAPDRSISMAEAEQMGFPPLDKLWSAEELGEIADILTDLALTDPNRLPRLHSDRSRIIFTRLISPEHLELFQVSDLTLADRMSQAFLFNETLTEIFGLYRSAFRGMGRGDSEMVDLVAAQFRLAKKILELGNEYTTLIKRTGASPNLQPQIQGVETLKTGAATIAQGSLQSLTERELYRSSERVRLIIELKSTLPSLLAQLDPQPRAKLINQLESLANNPSLEDLQPNLNELRNLVRTNPRIAQLRPDSTQPR